MSSNGNIFRVTGHLCGEFTGPRWISHTKANDTELWCLLWSAHFDLRPNKRLSKQSWAWLFEALSCPLWRHRNECLVWLLYIWFDPVAGYVNKSLPHKLCYSRVTSMYFTVWDENKLLNEYWKYCFHSITVCVLREVCLTFPKQAQFIPAQLRQWHACWWLGSLCPMYWEMV